MNKLKCEETEILINEKIDGEINPEDSRKLDEHLTECEDCRQAMEEMSRLIKQARSLSMNSMPKKDLWLDIHTSITKGSVYANGSHLQNNKRSSYRYYIYAFAAVFFIAGIIFLLTKLNIGGSGTNSPVYLEIGTFWKVSNVSGSPKIERENKEQSVIQAIDSFKAGEYLITDSNSKAIIKISEIGDVTVKPNSKVQFLNSAAGNNRIKLEYGTIDASITAEPEQFFVEAVGATVVDLGCEYTFSVDSSGDGVIYVTEGMVKLESPNRESLVPAGKMCLTKKDIGPGTPYRADSSPELKKALINFDFNNCANECVRQIVKAASDKDAYTLISMAPRVDDDERVFIYNTVSNYAKPPRNVPADTIKFNRKYWKDWSEQFGKELQKGLEEGMKHLENNMKHLEKDIEIQIEKSMEMMDEAMKNMKFEFQFIETPDENDNSHQKHKMRFYRKFRGDDGKYYEFRDTIITFDKEAFKEDMKQFKEDMKKFKEDMKNMNKDLELNNEELNESLKELENMQIEVNIDNMKFNEKLQKEIQEEIKKEMDKVQKDIEEMNKELEKENNHRYKYEYRGHKDTQDSVKKKVIIIEKDEEVKEIPPEKENDK